MKTIRLIIMASLFVLGHNVFGQTMDDVINLFNEAAEKTNRTDYANAVVDFEQLIEKADAVGAEANDLRQKALEQLPVLYWQLAAAQLRQRRFEESIPLLEKVHTYSTEANNAQNKERAERTLPQVYVSVGTLRFRDKQFEESLDFFDKALAIDPEFTAAWMGKGLAYAEMEEEMNMVSNLEKAIELARATNDENTLQISIARVARYYTEIGNMELEAIDEFEADYTYAIEFYQKALEYDPHYYDANYELARIYNQQIEYDLAIEHALNGIKNEIDELKVAALQFELGNAYINTAQYDEACEAFKKAMVGPIEEGALRRMERIPGCN